MMDGEYRLVVGREVETGHIRLFATHTHTEGSILCSNAQS